MKGNEYNELWTLLEYLDPSATQKIPEEVKDHIKAEMVPNGETGIDPSDPFNETRVSRKAILLLAMLHILYLVENDQQRWELIEDFNRNQLIYDGKEVVPMTEEEYQKSLEEFDHWNEFGLLPFWAESRRWQPKVCYELVQPTKEADLIIGKYGLKEVYVSPEKREIILKEAKKWVLSAEIRETREQLNPQDFSWQTSTEETEDFYKEAAVILDGHFAGAFLEIKSPYFSYRTMDSGMEKGILLINGKKAGETAKYEHVFMDGKEVRTIETIYSLRRKSDKQQGTGS